MCLSAHSWGIGSFSSPWPLIAFAYSNLVLHRGADRFCTALRESGLSGVIAPDIPIDEVDPLSSAAERHGIDVILLASPATPPGRRAEIAKRSQRFVYAVSVMAPTGEQTLLPDAGRELVTSLKQHTDQPVRVTLVQPDGWLIEHVQHTGQPRAEQRCQPQPLRLARR